jgi:hypothetical protein
MFALYYLILISTNISSNPIIKLSRTLYETDNLRPICGSCNSSMGTKNMIEFLGDGNDE